MAIETGYMHFESGLQFMNKGIHLLQIAAQNGNEEALFKLGELYTFGIGVQQNTNKALDYFNQASVAAGNPELYCICFCPDDGSQMIACDSCDKWFHCRCVDIDSNNLPDEYKCPNCSK